MLHSSDGFRPDYHMVLNTFNHKLNTLLVAEILLDCKADNVRLDYYCNYRITVSPQDKKTKKTADKLLATFTKHQHSWQILILKPLFVLYIRCLCLSFVCIRIAVHNQVMNPT